jgi:hypothetical protein
MKYSTIILAIAFSFNTIFGLTFSKRPPRFDYKSVIQKTASMVSDRTARNLAQKHGLNILNVTWEDTGRYKNSSVGPNISDMTIQVQQKDKRGNYNVTCMPVIRFPNFSDKTGDISSDKFFLLVGNERGKGLKKVTLKEFLGNIRKYLSKPGSWKGGKKSMLAKRDSHMLVSAQACFLPIPKSGTAEFNPVIFNYQSYSGDPAVLTILATREGTSVTVIDNKRDGFQTGFTWGQRLFFNQDGERASLTGERMSDYKNNTENNKKNSTETSKKNDDAGLNMVMLIQVPLKQKNPMRFGGGYCFDACEMAPAAKSCKKERSNVENAVIGHGKVEGPFTEIDNLDIERDPAFPIRITVQFYKATDNGVVSENDMHAISTQIDKVYDEADYVGSLVTGGCTNRPTEYIGDKNEPIDWWHSFWKRHNKNMEDVEEENTKMFFGW